jgi:basic membrane protein A and related proteins
MKFKKLLSLGITTILASSLLVGCSTKTEETTTGSEETLKVAMVTDVGGVNDQSFNQSAWEGLQKAKKELGADVKYLESTQDADYAPNIETLVDEDNDLIIGVGYKMADAILEAAENYPEQNFAIIDHDYTGDGKEIPKNINCILFNEQEASYLVGLIAGKMSQTGNVGFIGGMKSPVIERFQYGYMAGVEAANPETQVSIQYANSFTDAAKGKSIANQMYSQGSDIIFSAAGNVGTGAIEAAKEQNKYAIGVDRDQNDLAPDHVITSAMKRVDTAVYNTVKALKDNNFEGGKASIYGLKEDGVGIAPTTSKNVAPDVLDFVNAEGEKIKSGDIKVPANEEEYKAMKK